VPKPLLVIGGSAGALEPLRRIVADLSTTFPAPVLVTLHLPSGGRSVLPEVLEGAGPLPARHPRHGEELVPGTIFVAPPDRHLVVRDDVVHLSRGPRENRHRPSVDALFNSAARWHGPGVVAVVLSGALDDGAAGAAAVAAQDGAVVVQDPDDASVTGMPLAASRAVRRALLVPSAEIGTLVERMVSNGRAGDSPPASEFVRWESDNVDVGSERGPAQVPGTPVAMGCPECHGGMFVAEAESEREAGGVHYLCHVGHSWSPESLVAAQREASEAAMYAAAVKLMEEAMVLRQLASSRSDAGLVVEAEDHRSRADEAERQAVQIQSMVRSPD
jgi:two-component system chemotaxis response regulator CheB